MHPEAQTQRKTTHNITRVTLVISTDLCHIVVPESIYGFPKRSNLLGNVDIHTMYIHIHRKKAENQKTVTQLNKYT